MLTALLLLPGWSHGQPATDAADGPPQTSARSSLAGLPAYPYYTSSPYERHPVGVYPERPVEFLRRREEAIALRIAGECEQALPLLTELTQEYADDGELWAGLGLCQAELGQRRDAISSLQAALALGTTQTSASFETLPAEIMVAVGLLYAREGEKAQALHWLQEAVHARYTGRPFLAQRPELQALLSVEELADLAGLAPAGDWTRVERWRFDIAFLRDQVATLHYDPDHLTSAAQLERYLDALSRDVPDLSDEQIVARLVLFMGKLGAGHDLFLFDPDGPGSPRSFAVRPYFFTDGLYVIEAQDESLVSARIDAIAGKPVAEVYEVVSQSMARDNNMTTRWTAPSVMMNPVMLEALGIVERSEDVTITVTDHEGRHRELRPELAPPPANTPALAPPPESDAPLYLSRLTSPYWLEPLPNAKALYVQINGMRNGPDETIAEFIERIRMAAARHESEHLILDLRHNVGGNVYPTYALLRALVYFDAAPDKGRLFVLIGRNTYSAAQGFLARLDPLTDAVLVGEPTSSRPNTLGRAGQFRLPFSGHFGLLSSEYSQSSMPEDHRIWTAPDMPVDLTSGDWLAGKDPAMEAILESL